MDLWVVAAATGAGYFAKYLQNSAGKNEELAESSPFCRLARKKRSKYTDVCSRIDEDATNENNEVSDILTLSFQDKGVDVGEKSEYIDFFGNGVDISHELETNELARNDPFKSRRDNLFSIKRVTPLQSCLTKVNVEKFVKRGYTLSPTPSPSIPFWGPLLVNRIVNRDSREFADDISLGEENELLRPHLSRQSGFVKLPITSNHKVKKGQMKIGGSGPLNGMVLFFAGITIGIISSIIANKRELDNMNSQLKDKDNLVRDLHEEIEMRDRLNVKEIFEEDDQSIQSINNSSGWELVVSSSKQDLEESTKHNNEELDGSNVVNPELMSEIEAELEAELEKLELSITPSRMEGISDYVELDPDFEAEVVQGDLKIHMPQSECNNDTNETSTYHTHSSNYVVSPSELSLRLHKVIESRLEARIEELEQALKNSQKRHSIEWLRKISIRASENGEVAQTYTYEVDDMNLPLCMSFPDEALDDYNEGYQEETPFSICNELLCHEIGIEHVDRWYLGSKCQEIGLAMSLYTKKLSMKWTIAELAFTLLRKLMKATYEAEDTDVGYI